MLFLIFYEKLEIDEEARVDELLIFLKGIYQLCGKLLKFLLSIIFISLFLPS